MKFAIVLIATLILTSCSTTQLMGTWKNPDIDSYNPNKVLIIGITSNAEARRKFEQQIQKELSSRGTEAVTSLEFLGPSFGSDNKTEEQLGTLEDSLLNDGFDTILLTKVVGVEDKIAYSRDFDSYDEIHKKFREDYVQNQGIYNNPDYYHEYTVYHAETSMYCICPTEDKELIWKGYVDIIDPQSVEETVDDYAKLITLVLEEQHLIGPLNNRDEENKEAIN